MLNIFDGNEELSLNQAINRSLNLVNSTKGPIFSLNRYPRYNDEPYTYQYGAWHGIGYSLNNEIVEYSGGISFDKHKAIIKALGEGLERYCLSCYKREDLIYDVEDRVNNSIPIKSFVGVSEKQMENPQYNIFKSGYLNKFWWTKGYSLTQNRFVSIPAQLIYVPYEYKNEAVIRLPITTGAALGSTLLGAVSRGLLEVIERDAFMIYYLNKLNPPHINMDNGFDKRLKVISDTFRKYNLELHVLDITTDVPVTSIMAIIIDKTGWGPAVSVGLKASVDFFQGVLGAIEEAEQVRIWIRDEMFNKQSNKNSTKKINGFINLEERGLFWAKVGAEKHLSFFFKNSDSIPFSKPQKIKRINTFEHLIDYFTANKIEVAYKEVTQPEVRKQGFRAVKVVVPSFQPLFLTEDIKYLGSDRLRKVPFILGYRDRPTLESEFNDYPHPFL